MNAHLYPKFSDDTLRIFTYDRTRAVLITNRMAAKTQRRREEAAGAVEDCDIVTGKCCHGYHDVHAG